MIRYSQYNCLVITVQQQLLINQKKLQSLTWIPVQSLRGLLSVPVPEGECSSPVLCLHRCLGLSGWRAALLQLSHSWRAGMVLNILECDKKLPMYALAAKVGDGTLGCIRKVWADDPSPQLCGKTQLESWEFCSMFSSARQALTYWRRSSKGLSRWLRALRHFFHARSVWESWSCSVCVQSSEAPYWAI